MLMLPSVYQHYPSLRTSGPGTTDGSSPRKNLPRDTAERKAEGKRLLAEQVADAFQYQVYFKSIVLTTIVYLGNMYIYLLSSQPLDLITLIQFYLPIVKIASIVGFLSSHRDSI